MGRKRLRRLLLVVGQNVNDKAVLYGLCAFVVNSYQICCRQRI